MIREISTTIDPIANLDHSIPIEEIIRRTCAPGFKSLDFNFFAQVRNPTLAPFVKDDWQKWIERAVKTAHQYGAHFIQTHAPIYNQFEHNPFYDEMTERCIEATALCGAKWMVIHAGYYQHTWQEENLTKVHEDNLRWFEPYLKLARKVGVGILIENKIETYGGNLEQLLALVDAFGAEDVKICWDTGHAHVAGYQQKEGLIAVGKRLAGLHIHDNDGQHDSHLQPREGNLDWQSFIDGLDAIGYEGHLTFETSSGVRHVPKDMEDVGLQRLYDNGIWLNSLSRS